MPVTITDDEHDRIQSAMYAIGYYFRYRANYGDAERGAHAESLITLDILRQAKSRTQAEIEAKYADQ